MNPLALGGVVEAVGKIADDLITSDKERLDAEIEMRKLGLEEKRIDQAGDMAQIGVNTEEAKSSNWFVAGWRPGAGWVGVAGLAYAAVIEPTARFVAQVGFGYDGPFPEVNSEITLQVLFGLLGLGALRSFEKSKGVSK
jgi:hypothetical protein